MTTKRTLVTRAARAFFPRGKFSLDGGEKRRLSVRSRKLLWQTLSRCHTDDRLWALSSMNWLWSFWRVSRLGQQLRALLISCFSSSVGDSSTSPLHPVSSIRLPSLGFFSWLIRQGREGHFSHRDPLLLLDGLTLFFSFEKRRLIHISAPSPPFCVPLLFLNRPFIMGRNLSVWNRPLSYPCRRTSRPSPVCEETVSFWIDIYIHFNINKYEEGAWLRWDRWYCFYDTWENGVNEMFADENE